MTFLISPEAQPNGFVIADFLIAASFTNADAFIAVETGPLGSSHLVRASRNGGIGGSTLTGSEGRWVGYWHEQSGLVETVPKTALRIDDNGEVEKLPVELRGLLGSLAGPAPGQQLAQASASLSTTAPTAAMGPVSISMTAMQPIKLGTKGKMMEEAMIAPPKGLLHDDDEEKDIIGQDSVLLSRSKSGKTRHVRSTCSRISQGSGQYHWTKQQEGELLAINHIIPLRETCSHFFFLFTWHDTDCEKHFKVEYEKDRAQSACTGRCVVQQDAGALGCKCDTRRKRTTNGHP